MKRLFDWFPRWKAIFALVVFVFAVVSVASPQAEEEGSELEATLKNLSNDVAQAYVSPIVSAFGSNLNGGWFHKTPPPKIFALDFEFGLVGMGTFLPDDPEYKHFSTSASFRFDSSQSSRIFDSTGLSQDQIDAIIAAITGRDFNVSVEGATIIGDPDDYINVTLTGGQITVPDPDNPGSELTIDLNGTVELPIAGFGEYLAQISFLPFAAPQVGVGTILGTRAVFRYIPEIAIPMIDITEDIGKFSWFGWGLQHNPGVIFPTPLPLDVSLSFFKQTLKLGDVFEASTTAFGLTVSKKLGVGLFNLTPYAGYLIERSKMNFTYDFVIDEGLPEAQVIPVEFELQGENKSRIIVGLSLKLLMFNFNADYNIGNYNSVTVGVMISL